MTDTDETIAWDSDALALSDTERIQAKHAAQLTPQPSADDLITELERVGQDQSILEAALGLPLAEYRRVEQVYRRVDRPRYPARRGR